MFRKAKRTFFVNITNISNQVNQCGKNTNVYKFKRRQIKLKYKVIKL